MPPQICRRQICFLPIPLVRLMKFSRCFSSCNRHDVRMQEVNDVRRIAEYHAPLRARIYRKMSLARCRARQTGGCHTGLSNTDKCGCLIAPDGEKTIPTQEPAKMSFLDMQSCPFLSANLSKKYLPKTLGKGGVINSSSPSV